MEAKNRDGDTLKKEELDGPNDSNAKELAPQPLTTLSDEIKAQNKHDGTVIRRIRVGERLEEAFSWPHVAFEDLESPCSLQEYLQDIVRRYPQDIELLLRVPEAQASDVWLYEHLRQLCLELTYLVVQLMPECTSESCPDMKANECVFLCAAHETPQGCCAIEYIVHTLDGATSLLNNTRHFPSRISIPNASIKHFLSISRRLHRVFAHTWYHHKNIFVTFENETHLYARFVGLSAQYKLTSDLMFNVSSSTEPDPQSALSVNDDPFLNFAAGSKNLPSEA